MKKAANDNNLDKTLLSVRLKKQIIRMLRNELLEENEIEKILQTKIVWSVLKEYLVENIYRYDVLHLLEVLCK